MSPTTTETANVTQNEGDKRRFVTVPDEVWVEAKVVAVRTGRSLSEVVTAALAEYTKAA